MKNTAIKWGLIGGLATIVAGLIFFIIDLAIDSKLRYLTFFISVGVLLAALFEFRDKVNGGYATVGSLFQVGLLAGLVIGLLNGVWGVVYPIFIDPSMKETILLQTEINLEEAGLDKAQIKEAMKWSEMMFKPWIVFIMGVVGSVFTAVLVSLPAALILKREKPQGTEEIIDSNI